MAGNAHARRHGHRTDCIFCAYRPKEARAKHIYRNSCHGSRNKKGKVSGTKKKSD